MERTWPMAQNRETPRQWSIKKASQTAWGLCFCSVTSLQYPPHPHPSPVDPPQVWSQLHCNFISSSHDFSLCAPTIVERLEFAGNSTGCDLACRLDSATAVAVAATTTTTTTSATTATMRLISSLSRSQETARRCQCLHEANKLRSTRLM